MTKKLAVLMPAYNAENFIVESIDSLLNQTFQDFELIIVNDGSTDGTLEILKRISKEYQKVKVFHQENKGVIETRNRLLEIAGDQFMYLAWCDADDVYDSRKLERQINFLDSRPDYIGCGTWYQKFGSATSKVFSFVAPEALYWLSLFGTPVGFPTFMHRNVSGLKFNPDLTSAEDYEFACKLIDKGRITNLRGILTMYRVHESQESSKNKNRQYLNHKGIAIHRINDFMGDVFSNEELDWLLSPTPYDRELHESVKLKFREKLDENEYEGLMRVLQYRVIVYNKTNPIGLINIMKRDFLCFISLYKLFFRGAEC